MLKIAYFDADGTLVSFRTHQMPEDAREALRILGNMNVKRILCTGRNREAAAPLRKTGLFDGFIYLNGQLCELNGSILRAAPIAPQDLEIAIQAAETGEFTLEFVDSDDNFLSRVDDYVRRANAAGGMSPLRLRPVDEARHMAVYQLHLYGPRGCEDALVARCTNLRAARWADDFADVFPADGGKAAGMCAIEAALGLTSDQTIAFGDGDNDIEMLRHAGIGIAMGNASPNVREVADYVTPSVDDGGVLQAVRYFLEKQSQV